MRGRCCAWAGLWSMSVRLVPPSAAADHAGYRRHLRRGPWRPAVAPVQRPLRRIRLPADRRLRWRGPLRRRPAAPGEAAEGRRDPRLSASPGAGDPQPLARGRDPPSRRQPLRLPGGPRLVRGEQSRLHPRPRPQQHAPPHITGLEKSTAARFEAAPSGGKVRRFKEFYDAARTWSRVRRIVARVEAGATAPTAASSSPTSATATAVRCIRNSTAGAARRRTTSRPGKPISPPTAPRAPRPPPISSGCSCTPAPIGCCGVCAR